jgi:4-diphosphocytidyl-2-C-methyl-D-erythritol kinase
MPVAMPHRSFAHAKINLSLHVLAREAVGYHQIETLFCSLELADEIEISYTTGGVTLEVMAPPEARGAPPDLGPPGQNLAFRAASLFAAETTFDQGIHIRLVKRIPAGAGLGGGSSDAAAVLRAMNELSDRPLTDDTLRRLGASLGSDVPFFLAAAPLALAWGRGERLMPLPPLAAVPVVLAVPRERVSTAAAYGALDAARGVLPAIVHVPRTWSDIAAGAHNDFEDVVFARHPHLRTLRQAFHDAGATIARMTGTGSVVFGVFQDVTDADTAARHVALAYPDVQTIVTQTRTSA